MRRAGHRIPERALAAALILSAGGAAGCVLALPPYNEPFEERLVVVAPSPASYEIAIAGSGAPAEPVPADGRVVLPFPVLPRSCSTHLLGMRLLDRRVEHRKLILIQRNGRVVKRLSVSRLRRLPVDRAGYFQLELG